MIKEQFEQDGKNAIETQRFLNEEYTGCADIFDELDAQFEKLKDLASVLPQVYNVPTIAKFWILLACQQQLRLAATNLFRGHISDSFGHLRRSIELTAAGGKIVAEPDFAQLWFDSGKGATEYKNYKEKSNVSHLWNNTLTTVPKLRDKYALISQKVHISVVSMVNQIGQQVEGKKINLSFAPHELTTDGTELMIGFVFSVDTLIQVLDGLAEIFDVHQDKGFQITLNSLRGKLSLIRGAFKSKIDWNKVEAVIPENSATVS